jgi:tRNA(fMet)-specific endonuclease VapC
VGYLIDTSVLVAIERQQLTRDVLTEEAAISVITVSELLHGTHRATPPHRTVRRAGVDRVLSEFPVIDVTLPVAQVHAEIWAALEQQGTPVGGNDLWIGATAIAHGLGVLTRNAREFARIPGLRVVPA